MSVSVSHIKSPAPAGRVSLRHSPTAKRWCSLSTACDCGLRAAARMRPLCASAGDGAAVEAPGAAGESCAASSRCRSLAGDNSAPVDAQGTNVRSSARASLSSALTSARRAEGSARARAARRATWRAWRTEGSEGWVRSRAAVRSRSRARAAGRGGGEGVSDGRGGGGGGGSWVEIG